MATILEGLNAISQAVGGAGEAESNLEALNQISEALGGSADATENAEAIANIAENASGGGGSSDFSTVEVTVTNNSTLDAMAFVPIRVDESGMSFAAPSFEIASGARATENVILCQGASLCNIDMSSAVAVNITATGSIQVVPDTTICHITGSGTITISDPQ